MFCQKCGNRLNDDDMFCPKCGTAVKHEHDARLQDTVPIDQDALEKTIILNNDAPVDETVVWDSEKRISSDRVIRKIDIEKTRMQYYDNPEDYAAPSEELQDVNLDEDDFYMEDDEDDFNEVPKQKVKPAVQEKHSDKGGGSPGGNHNGSKAKIIAAAIVIIVAVIAIAAIILFKMYRNKQVEEFNSALQAYRSAVTQSDAQNSSYAQLLAEAERALESRDYDAFYELTRRMREASEAIESEAEQKEQLSALKSEYDAVFLRYRITDEYKETYDNVMAALDSAIAGGNESKYRDIKKQLESLQINLTTANKQAIQSVKNEINKLDLTKANEAEKTAFNNYGNAVNQYIGVDNYAEALNTLETWLTAAKKAEERIKAEEKAARESWEKESRDRETETEETTDIPEGGGYILPESSTRQLEEADLSGLTKEQLLYARNEIYARHGRKFKDENIQKYFNNQQWYTPAIEPDAFDEAVLSEIEKANVAFIKAHE